MIWHELGHNDGFNMSSDVGLTSDDAAERLLCHCVAIVTRHWLESAETLKWATSLPTLSARVVLVGLMKVSVGRAQTPSTGLRHPSRQGGRCRKAVLGVWVEPLVPPLFHTNWIAAEVPVESFRTELGVQQAVFSGFCRRSETPQPKARLPCCCFPFLGV